MRVTRQVGAPHRARAGFSLVELMVVVAIIGIISTIAAPAFRGFVVRAKRAERVGMLPSIFSTLEEFYNANSGAFANASNSATNLSGSYNPIPPSPFVGDLKPWATGQAGWSSLAFAPEGAMRYSYSFAASAYANNTAPPIITLSTEGDVDGDGIIAYHQETWTQNADGAWYNSATSDTCSTSATACD